MKQIVITGGNAGIGFETVRELAARGHNITIMVRNKKKGQEVIDRLRSEQSGVEVSMVLVDLSSYESIQEASGEILEKHPLIDVLIHNAGTFQSGRHVNAAGIELTFMVNHVAPFYMTHLLLPGLIKSNESRVISVNSDSHYLASFDPDNLNLDHRYHGLRAYGRSKLANVYFTYEFERRNPHKHLSVFALHPGLVNTDIGAKDASFFHRLIWNWRSRSGKTPAQGAETSIFLASEERNKLTSGTYWDDCKLRKSSRISYNKENARILWDRTMEMCGLSTYF